jgi:hypothetical protein
MSEHDNRRQFPRHACDVAMDGVRKAPKQAFACRALNASEGGLLIETDAVLAPGERLTLSLRGTDRSRAMDAEVEVVRAESEDGLTLAGVKYLRRREEFVV